MKKKVLSAMMLFAVAAASTSTFVSCSDYDDEINDLQEQVDKLASKDELTSKISEMQAAIATAKQEAIAKAEAAQTVATAAQTAAKNAQDAADKAQAKADELEKNGATKAEVEAAQAAADKAQAAATQAQADAEQAKADALAELKKVQETLQSSIDAATESAKEARTAADDALAQLEEYKKTNDVANSETEKAAAKAQAAADAAEKLAAQADLLSKANAELIAALQSSSATQTEVDAVVSSIEALRGENLAEGVNLSDLNTRLSKIESVIVVDDETGAGKVDLKAMSDSIEAINTKLKAIIGEYSTMVTSVSLYVSERDDVSYGQYALNFVRVTEKANKFGAETDSPIEFTEGYTKTYEASRVIRVSPTSATLNPANIHLMNSQGVELDDYVVCSKVEPYKELLTRAGADNGLWKVYFKLKDGYDPEGFKAAVEKDSKNILFAIAVNNTSLNNDNRRVITRYALTVGAEDGEIATNGFYVEGKDGPKYINNIHNRYTNSEALANGMPAYTTTNIQELSWLNDLKPGTVAILTGDNANAANRIRDNRTNKPCLNVEVNKAINIYVDCDEDGNVRQEIAGFYVTLDDKYAVESYPSELNAWNSYEYENVGKTGVKAHMFKGNTGSIMIKSNQTIDDIIGFRVYAVNLDGTLLDPDGRAFYVSVGNAIQTETVSGNVVAQTRYNSESDFIEVPDGFIPTKMSGYSLSMDSDNPKYKTGSTEVSSPTFTVKYYDKDKKAVSVYSRDKVKYVKFVMPDASNYIDGETYTATMTLWHMSKDYTTIQEPFKTITYKMTKVMPTECKALTFIKEQNYATYAYRPYMYPVGRAEGVSAYKIIATDPTPTKGSKNLKNIFVELSSDSNYELTFVNCKADDNGKYTKDLNVTSANSYVATVDEELIDNTARTMTYKYIYPQVSTSYNADKDVWTVAGDYSVKSGNSYTVDFACWHHAQTWKLGKDAAGKTHKINLQWTTNGNESFTMPLSWIASENSLNGEIFAKTLDVLLDNNQNYHYLNFGSDKKVVIDDATARYFTGTINEAAGTITFVQNLQMDQNPTKDFTVNASFKVYDVFGHEITISIPVTILRQPNE